MKNDECCRLIEAIAERQDKAAFATLFQHFAPRLKAYAIRTGCGSAEAEELAQETMICVWCRARSFDRMKAGVSTWIFRIVRNKRIDLARRQKGGFVEYDQAEHELMPVEPDDGRRFDRQRARETLRERLKSLPPEQYLVLQKAFFEFKTYKTVARELEVPLGTVKSRVRLAMQRLRESSLEPYGT